MLNWIGVLLPKDFSLLARDKIKNLNSQVGLNEEMLNFPMHISLKKMFEFDDYLLVCDELEKYFNTIEPFEVETDKVDNFENILWISFKKNEYLEKIHKDIDDILLKNNIPITEIDSNFVFHTTLFLDTDLNKILKMKSLLKKDFRNIKLQLSHFAFASQTHDLMNGFDFRKPFIVTRKENYND